MVPAVENRLLPDSAASRSENVWLYSGALKGINAATSLRSVSSTTGKVFRIPNSYTDAQYLLNSTWMDFEHPDTDVLRATVIGDTYDRYYWASPADVPRYNTHARIASGNNGLNSPFKLGIPAPSAPSLGVAGGASTTLVSRAYVYTWVTEYGEEGPPSDPVSTTGQKSDATFTLTLVAAAAADLGTDRNLKRTRIYRTVTSSAGVATYFLVTEMDIGTLTYADTLSDAVVSANSELESTTWSGPPTDLKGFVAMPNGIFAGFRENEIWFSVPFRPHAWPVSYALVVDYPIVGLGVVAQTCVVCTQGYPVAVSGINPAFMTESKLVSFEPCMSRGSIVSAPEGVYYASPNGLVLVSQGVAQNITKDLLTKDKWRELVTSVSTLRAARLAGGYYAYGSIRLPAFEDTAFDSDGFNTVSDDTGAQSGIFIDPINQRIAFNTLSNTLPCTNLMNDSWSGELFIIRNSVLYWLDVGATSPTSDVFMWKSKDFEPTKKNNFSAIKVFFDTLASSPTLNVTRNTNLVQTLAADQYGLVRVYADGILKSTHELRTSGEVMRLPSGFKADTWNIEIEARVIIHSVQMATSVKELMSV